jgi:hypothetical protein
MDCFVIAAPKSVFFLQAFREPYPQQMPHGFLRVGNA